REFQGQALSPFASSASGKYSDLSCALLAATKRTNFGKLSSNGPRSPFGYQMKWPMPSEAKFSPAFHEVRPSIVPLHSFCQIRFPMRRVSAGERLIAAVTKEHVTKRTTIARAVAFRGQERARRLDEGNLFNSMPVPAALRLESPAALAPILLMNHSIICFAAVFAAS